MKFLSVLMAAFLVIAPMSQSASAATVTPEILKLRQQAINKTFDAIQLLAAQRRAAVQIINTTTRFSPEWEAAKAEFRALSRQIFFLQRKWVQSRFETRRGVLLYYFDYACDVISPT